ASGGLLCRECGAAEEGEYKVARHGFRKDTTAPGSGRKPTLERRAFSGQVDRRAPSLVSLTLRLMFMALGPLNYLLDIFFLSGDPHRQSLRDKFAQTYVVKKRAEPMGSAPIVYAYYEICGYNFLFREVTIGDEADHPPSATAATSR